MTDISDNKLDLILDKLNYLEKRFDDMENFYKNLEFEIETLKALERFEQDKSSFKTLDKKEFLDELRSW